MRDDDPQVLAARWAQAYNPMPDYPRKNSKIPKVQQPVKFYHNGDIGYFSQTLGFRVRARHITRRDRMAFPETTRTAIYDHGVGEDDE